MLPTFVIGLREGLEAALIVGIIAAFLRTENRMSYLRYVWIGVGAAVALCLAVAVALRLAQQNLPQKEQEGLETIIGLVAVVCVSWMILWMRKHARSLKGELEGQAAAALATGGAIALVGMAFLAVLREGFETAVFALAVFDSTDNVAAAGFGVFAGIGLAALIGWGIYRGGVHINLAKFFKLTGVVLVFVAAGLMANAMHTAHEAGWLNSLQGQTFDLSWLVAPGSVRAALITGMFGIQPKPVVAEILAFVSYAIVFTIIVLRPQRSQVPKQRADVSASPALTH
jgi:high-affinity iron transporter